MSVFTKIKNLLDSNNINYQVLEHEPVSTCEDAALTRNTSHDQGAKALIMYADNQPIQIVLPCSRKLDFKIFKTQYSINDLRLATPNEVFNLTTLKIGAIPPLGNLFNLPIYIDKKLLEEDSICFNAGEHNISIFMKKDDYLKIIKPVVGNFTIPK